MTKLIGDDVKMFVGDWNGNYTELALHDSPPLVPAFAPSPAQIRFMRLHAWHHVEKWQWHWLQTMLRATTDRGVTATLWVDSVEELIREGLMEAGMGYAMSVTDAGRELLARERNRV
jgi:hypothetical protein